VTIANAGKPVAQLTPVRAKPIPRVRGVLKGQVRLGPEFDEALSPDLLDGFEVPD
jgi:antitoxin (DNA-binding transcriptional repressor) of toxin-antitoxin stability system